MSTLMANFTTSKEAELSRLRAENQALSDELLQCRADKEFVWSLWKRLQVANPDITQAVGLVAQREKEKAEMKDRKVLEILNVKDDKIDELQKLVGTQSKELSELILKRAELEERSSTLERDNASLRVRLDELDNNVRNLASRDAIRELDMQNLELKQELNRKQDEIGKLKKEKEYLETVRDSHREQLKALEDEIKEQEERHEASSKEHDGSRRQMKKLEQQVTSLQKQLKAKSRELEDVRAEMAEIWSTHRQTADHAAQQADVIRQLQGLQADTQRMLQNTESAHIMETMTLQTEKQTIRDTEMELRRQLETQGQTIEEQEKLLQELQTHLESKEATLKDFENSGKVNSRLSHMHDEIEHLKYKLNTRSRSASPSPTRSRTNTKKSRLKERSRSLSASSDHRHADALVLARRLENTERKLADTQLLLHLKAKELEEMRCAHNRRLERLKAVQTDHKLVKQQCAMLEEELYGPKRPSKKLKRSTPRSLQREDSDGVWNELAFFKKQAKNHQVENVNLQEECDALKVKLTQCEATIHELRACLEQEREELQFVLDQQKDQQTASAGAVGADHELEEVRRQLNYYKQQLHSCKAKLQQQETESRLVDDERTQAHEERRALKSEINLLRQQDASYRIKIADFKTEVSRLQRELKRYKRNKSAKKDKTKQYQQTLNKSIQAMSQVFDDFNKDGWEDVMPSEDRVVEDATLTSADTGASLGEEIVAHAQNSLRDDDRSFAGPRLSSTPSRGRPLPRFEDLDEYKRMSRAENGVGVSRRSVALSPIRLPATTGTFPDSSAATTLDSHTPDSTPRRTPRTRSVALSPVRFPSPGSGAAVGVGCAGKVVVSKKAGLGGAGSGPNTRQVQALKQRVTALINQVNVIKAAKDACTRSSVALRVTVEQLEGELSAERSRTAAHKNNVLRLNTEVDRLKADKELLEQRLHEQSIESSAGQPTHSDTEFATLQNRLKATTAEVSRQLAQIKSLKADNVALEEKVASLIERNKSLERDNAQKRLLAEDMKIKLKVIQENVKSDADIMEDVEHKMRTVSELNTRYKTQLDSLKTRLTAVTKEKSDNEDKVIKLSDELDRKNKLVSELQARARTLQSTVATVERTAQQQLTSLADHSEAAIDTAQARLTQIDAQLQEHHKFIKILAHTLASSTTQTRQLLTQQRMRAELLRHQQQRQQDESTLNKVKHLACDILDIDETQLHDILHAQDVDFGKLQELQKVEEQKKDKKWNKKWERVLQNKAEFSAPLVDVIMEKVDEKCRLSAEISVT